MQTRNFSLIVCTRNRCEKLSKMLDYIDQKIVRRLQGELVLVNSASTDCSLEQMFEYKEKAEIQVTVLDIKRPGNGLARREGAKAAKGKTLIFLDDDCYPDNSYLFRACNVLDEHDISFCGGRILLYSETDLKYTVNYYEKYIYFKPHSCIAAGTIQGGNFIINKDVLLKIGNFNPYIGAGCDLVGEDIEIAGRASMKGYSGAYVPELVVYHDHGRKDVRELIPVKKKYAVGRGAYYASMIWHGYFKYIVFWFARSILPGIRRGIEKGQLLSFCYEFYGFWFYTLLMPYYYLSKPIKQKDISVF